MLEATICQELPQRCDKHVQTMPHAPIQPKGSLGLTNCPGRCQVQAATACDLERRSTCQSPASSLPSALCPACRPSCEGSLPGKRTPAPLSLPSCSQRLDRQIGQFKLAMLSDAQLKPLEQGTSSTKTEAGRLQHQADESLRHSGGETTSKDRRQGTR